ncbi:hypothetical protein I4F81_007326 [Pyropia yezoensis]|uniref:Uncharacterized protein n=1 Tax=Pyropia yezoensis TaxID=2788 RepID=A0ACC3C4R8_PYRYE|nr:hypothetical protein I4F81_007326 [Neopyropia yezoensis]
MAALPSPLPPGTVARFDDLTTLLLEANGSTNLTAVRDADGVASKHIADALSLLPALDDLATVAASPRRGGGGSPHPLRVLDLGSGGGFPGLVLAIARPHWAVTLNDCVRKKTRWHAAAAAALGLPNVTPLWGRAEALGAPGSPHRDAYDAVTARAVAELRVLAELGLPLGFTRVIVSDEFEGDEADLAASNGGGSDAEPPAGWTGPIHGLDRARGRGGTVGTTSAAPRTGVADGSGGWEAEEEAELSGDEPAGVDGGGHDYENYVGQVGALAALGVTPDAILNAHVWRSRLSPEERAALRCYLPPELGREDQNRLAADVLSGATLRVGAASRDDAWAAVAAGLTHPRVRRWRVRVTLLARRHALASLAEYHNTLVRRVRALKAPLPLGEVPSAAAAIRSASLAAPSADETQRYQMPERSFTFINPWGNSVVSPLKRGPALDGGRPREHALLRNERPSHVTILCIVRDAASRLVHGRGTRADICDLLRDSQYLRDGATFSQLNGVVSGALDRLHYEDDAPVRYDPDTKHWCYLHNDRTPDSFPTPAWAREPDRAVARSRRSAAASRARKR